MASNSFSFLAAFFRKRLFHQQETSLRIVEAESDVSRSWRAKADARMELMKKMSAAATVLLPLIASNRPIPVEIQANFTTLSDALEKDARDLRTEVLEIRSAVRFLIESDTKTFADRYFVDPFNGRHFENLMQRTIDCMERIGTNARELATLTDRLLPQMFNPITLPLIEMMGAEEMVDALNGLYKSQPAGSYCRSLFLLDHLHMMIPEKIQIMAGIVDRFLSPPSVGPDVSGAGNSGE